MLPFTSEGGEPSDGLATSMTDDLTNMLSHVPGFRVISRQTSESYRGRNVDAVAVGTELGVRYLLEGSVSKRDGQLRVNVELVDTKSRLRVWSGRFERTGAEKNAVQDEIVNGPGRELQIEVAQIERERGSGEPDVHALVIEGWAAIYATGRSGVSALQKAEKYFTQALARDPDSRRAQVGLGAYHTILAANMLTPEPDKHFDKAQVILQQVLDRWPNTPGVHYYLATAQRSRGNLDEAVKLFERSLEINPSHASSYAGLGLTLVRMGRAEEGLEHILYAMRLSPRDPTLSYWLGFAGGAELELRRYGKAIDYLDRAVSLNSGNPPIVLTLVAAQALSGNVTEARLTLDQLQKARPNLTRDKLIERFDSGPRESQFRLGLRLALAPADPFESLRLPTGVPPGAD